MDGISTRGESEKSASSSTSPKVAPGQLTAGEWKDLEHWDFWTHLMENPDFANHQKYWGFYPQDRFFVKVSDQQHRPLANIPVQLVDEKNIIIWSAQTDNRGSAELWGNFNGGNSSKFQLQIKQNNTIKSVEAIPYQLGINTFIIEGNCSAVEKQVDVAFVVDATGSMNDEIQYLKAEVQNVIDRVEIEASIKMRSGAIYYTGINDSIYMTNPPLNKDHNRTIQFIKSKDKSGGGTEYMEGGLNKAVYEMNWQKTSCFQDHISITR